MAQYQCGTCGFFRNTVQLENHLSFKHNIHVSLTNYPYLTFGHQSLNRNYCSNCGKQFRSFNQTLKHLDTVHHIHIAYERGLTRKRIFLDGI